MSHQTLRGVQPHGMKRGRLRRPIFALVVLHALSGCGHGDSNPIDDMMGSNNPPVLALVFHESALPPPVQVPTEVKDSPTSDCG